MAEGGDFEDELEVALEVRGIYDAEDEVWGGGEGVDGELFVRGVREEGVAAGEV